MKILFVGGTGTISTACVKYALSCGADVAVLNRGHGVVPDGAEQIVCNINDVRSVKAAISSREFDCIADFTVFTPLDAYRDIELFSGKCAKYIFISSASAYKKGIVPITESVPLCNPWWEYSRSKAECEHIFLDEYEKNGFPAVIIRPSHTYCDKNIPLCIHGSAGSLSTLHRMQKGLSVPVLNGGKTRWTLTHADDFCIAFFAAAQHAAAGQCYHITGDEALCWNDIYKCIADALGCEYKPAYFDAERLCEVYPEYEGPLLGDKANDAVFDNTKIKAIAPDFICRIPFSVGAKRCVEYMLSHDDGRQDHAFERLCGEIASGIYL